ncbi:hypothetical protein [Curtobacterium sp. USHLN213]|uniref:hypothetical protein n=1 Tax=Curtobacterium sp. USHLN213 TaxID=3081255 RepID=UPI003015C3DA
MTSQALEDHYKDQVEELSPGRVARAAAMQEYADAERALLSLFPIVDGQPCIASKQLTYEDKVALDDAVQALAWAHTKLATTWRDFEEFSAYVLERETGRVA